MLPYKICILLLSDSQICICENYVHAWSPDMLWPTHAQLLGRSQSSQVYLQLYTV
jgi:hypothetical protein